MPKARIVSQGIHFNIAASLMPEQGVHRLGRLASCFSAHGPWGDVWRIDMCGAGSVHRGVCVPPLSAVITTTFFVSCAHGERGRRRLNSP